MTRPEMDFKKGKQSLKVVIYLKDGSLLRTYQSLVLLKMKISYNYYWFKDDNTLIIGWDNAEHHPEIETHPYHKHIGERKNVQASQAMDLRKVLAFIAKIIGILVLMVCGIWCCF